MRKIVPIFLVFILLLSNLELVSANNKLQHSSKVDINLQSDFADGLRNIKPEDLITVTTFVERFGVTRSWVAEELSKGSELHHIYQGLEIQESGGDYKSFIEGLYPERELTAQEKLEQQFPSVTDSVYADDDSPSSAIEDHYADVDNSSVTDDVYRDQPIQPLSMYNYDEIALKRAPLKLDQAPYSIGDDYDGISTIDGSLTIRETDVVLPGANGLDFELTRVYDSSFGKDEIYVDWNYGTNSTRTPKEESLFPLGKGWIWDISYIDFNDGVPYVYVSGMGKFAADPYGGGLQGLPYGYIDFGPAPSHIVLSNGEQAAYMLSDYSKGTFQYFSASGHLQEIRDEVGNKIVFLYNYGHPTYGLVLETVMTVTNDDRYRNHLSFVYRGKQSIDIYVGPKKMVTYNKGIIRANTREKETLVEVIDAVGRSTKYDYNVINFVPFNLRYEYRDFIGIDRLTFWGKQDWVYLSLIEHPTKAMTTYNVFTSDAYLGPYAVEYQLRYTGRDTFYSSSYWTEKLTLRLGFNGNYLGRYGMDTTFDLRTVEGEFVTVYSYKKKHRDPFQPDVFYLTKKETFPENNTSYKKVTTYTYDESKGRPDPTQIVERNYRGSNASSPKITTRTYDQWGFVSSETDPLGARKVYEYSGVSVNNRMALTKETIPINSSLNLVNQFRYDLQNGNLLSVSSTNNAGGLLGQVNYRYDHIGNAVQIDIKGSQKDTSIQQQFSPSYYYMYLTGQTVQTTNADGIIQSKTVGATYDVLTGDQLTFTDGNANLTTYRYDPVGRVTAEIYADGSQTTIQYNDNENSVTATDPAGVRTTMIYTPLGRLYKEITDRGSVEYEYDEYGRLRRIFDDHGSILSFYNYDEWGRLREENYYTSFTRYEYDEIANTKTIIDGEGNTTREIYDVVDRLIQVEEIRPTGNLILEKYAYDFAGNIVSHTDANGNVTTYSYDAMSRLTSVTDAEKKKFTYSYDLGGNNVSITYPDGQKITKRYDEIGRLTEQTDPMLKSERFYYDGNDNVIKHIDRKGQIHQYEYNERNILVRDQTADELISYTYDPAGKRLSMTDNTGTTAYSYFPTGELSSIQYSDGANLSFDYERRGLRTQQTFTSGSTVLTLHQTYNPRTPSPISLTVADAGGNILDSFTYSYQFNDFISALNTAHGYSETYAYDGVNLSGLYQNFNGTPTGQYEYGYDHNRNIIRRVENGEVSTFTYDVLNRMKTSSVFNESYAYDQRNNRHEMSSDRIPDFQSAAYAYDQRDRLTSVRTENGEVTYRYNGDGLMAYRIENGAMTRYYYDDRGLMVAEGTVGSDGRVTVTAGYIFDGKGRLFGRQVPGAGLQYYITNAHGDVTEIRDASGNVLNRYTYDIWGKPIVKEETVPNVFRYAGEYWDNTTSLQYLRARWYDPATARFIGEDPYEGELENPLSLNLYTYVYNNPLIYVDPSGNKTAMTCMFLCFAAGTMIETQDGPKAIEDIQVGDYVLAQSDVTGELAYKPVEETFNRVTEETFHIQVEDTIIVTTAEHPFWVVGKGWVEALELKEGDQLVDDEGKEYAIKQIEVKQETIRVYNFSVGDYHTYFVSELKIWTHNCSGGGGGLGRGLSRGSLGGGSNGAFAAHGPGGGGGTKSSSSTAGTKGSGNSKILWGSWSDYKKVNVNGQTYAKVGDRLYSKHAVDRMQPSGKRYGSPITQAGGDYGRSVSPTYVEDVIRNAKPVFQQNGNISYTSGTLQVITNKQGAVVTIITK